MGLMAGNVWGLKEGFRVKAAVLCELQAAGTNGGTFTNGAFRTRTLNTILSDPDGICGLAASLITLQKGTYLIEWSAPA